MGHPAGSLMVNLITTTEYENICSGIHSTTQHLTFPREIKSQLNYAYAVNLRSKQLD